MSQEELTPEQYQIRVLLQRISALVANYENQISQYETKIAQLESEAKAESENDVS